MRAALMLVGAVLLLGVSPAGAAPVEPAAPSLPAVTVVWGDPPEPLPPTFRHRSIELTFAEPEPPGGHEPAEDEPVGDDPVGDDPVGDDPVGDEPVPVELSGVAWPFEFDLLLGTASFEVTSIVATPGLACERPGWEWRCSVAGPGTYAFSVSGPEHWELLSCALGAGVRSLDGTVLAQIGASSEECMSAPPLPPPDAEDASEPLTPTTDTSPVPVGTELPATGSAPWLALVAAVVLLAGIALVRAARLTQP